MTLLVNIRLSMRPLARKLGLEISEVLVEDKTDMVLDPGSKTMMVPAARADGSYLSPSVKTCSSPQMTTRPWTTKEMGRDLLHGPQDPERRKISR